MLSEVERKRNRRKASVNSERRAQLNKYIRQLAEYWGTFNLYARDGGDDCTLAANARERALSFEDTVKARVAETKFHDKAQWFDKIEKAKAGPPKKRKRSRSTRTFDTCAENRLPVWTDDEGQTRRLVGVRWNLCLGRWAIRICTKHGDYENTHLGALDAEGMYALAPQLDYMRAFLVHNRWLTLHRWRSDQWNDVVMAKAYPPDITLDEFNPLHAHLAEWMRRIERKLFLNDTGSPWVKLRDIYSEDAIARAATRKMGRKDEIT